jgi:hypothetical protein
MNAIDAVEAASRHLVDGLKLLEAVEDIKQRRKIARDDVGRLVGALDKAMESAAADRKPHERALFDIVRDKIIGDAIGVLVNACEWEVRS